MIALTTSSPSMPVIRCVSKRGAAAAAFRHSIRVNDDDTEPSLVSLPSCCTTPALVCASPSGSSVDSGQCSAASAGGRLHVHDLSTTPGHQPVESARALPSYARVASTLDHVLRTAGTVLSLVDVVDVGDKRVVRELLQKVTILGQIVRQSPCGLCLDEVHLRRSLQRSNHVRLQDARLVFGAIADASAGAPTFSPRLLAAVKRVVKQTLLVFLRVLLVYLADCSARDRLLDIALDHFVHLILFDDDLCAEATRHGSVVEQLIGFIRLPATSDQTRRLSFRALAVLCGTPAGCARLISVRCSNSFSE